MLETIVMLDETVDQINRLFQEIEKVSLPKALEIGQLLAAKKEELGHGNFGPWLEANWPKDKRRTLNRYLKLWKERGKIDTVSNLTTAHKAVKQTKEPETLTPEKLDLRVRSAITKADTHLVIAVLEKLLAELKAEVAGEMKADWVFEEQLNHLI